VDTDARTAMPLNPILLPGNVVPPLSCSVVVGDQDLTTRKWTTTDMKSPYTIFFFFPMTSAVDSAEIIALKEQVDRLKELGCTVTGVTSESVVSILNWIVKDVSEGGFGGSVGFDILSDRDLSVAGSLGVKKASGLPARATFILDHARRVRHCSVNSRYIGRSVDELVRKVEAITLMDMNGPEEEVLAPADWVSGAALLTNDMSSLKEYFANSA